MNVIELTSITSAMLVSNVPETDAPAWAAGTYTLGQKVVKNHHLYESLADGNNAVPGAETATPLKWLDTGATNCWRMFDKGASQVIGTEGEQQRIYMIGTKTENPGVIDFTLTSGAVVNAVALFGLSGYRVTVTMTDPVDGVVYHRVVSLVDPSSTGMWEWLFKPLRRRKALALLDLPAYGTASIRIVIEADPGAKAACSMAAIGGLVQVGEACFGTSVGITDYSLKEVDRFGNEVLVEGGYRDRVQYDIRISTDEVAYQKDFLAGLRARPAVYIGDPDRQETINFGRFRDLQIVLSNPSYSECALDVGGLL